MGFGFQLSGFFLLLVVFWLGHRFGGRVVSMAGF